MRPVGQKPEHRLSPFVCPHCGVTAKQDWRSKLAGVSDDAGQEALTFDGYEVSSCHHCGEPSLWKGAGGDWRLAFPNAFRAPIPAENMPEEVLRVFNEAQGIAGVSPRAAAALLRLAVELLLTHLGATGKTLNDKVGWLVQQGVACNLQKALDSVRVSGNRFVHPLTIVEDDSVEVVDLLFRLVNYVVEALVTGRAEIEHFYQRLPEKARNAIKQRDDVA